MVKLIHLLVNIQNPGVPHGGILNLANFPHTGPALRRDSLIEAAETILAPGPVMAPVVARAGVTTLDIETHSQSQT